MTGKYGYLPAVLVPLLIITVIVAVENTRAQPGTESDPVVSLSYLDTALAYTPVSLEGGEDFRFTGGRGIVLLTGSCRLSLPADTTGGRFWVVDTTVGEVHESGIDMIAGHMYVPVSNEPTSAIFTIQAWQTSTIAVPGGTGQ